MTLVTVQPELIATPPNLVLVLEETYGPGDNMTGMFVTPESTFEEVLWSCWAGKDGRRIAYGFHALPKLRREMSDSNQLKAVFAIVQLSNILHDPEIAVRVLEMNFLPRFVKALKSSNVTQVVKSLECLRVLSQQPTGLSGIVKNKYIVETIRDTINHPKSMEIKKEAASTVNALAQNYFTVRTLVEAGYTKELVDCLVKMKETWEDKNTIYNLNMKNVVILHLDTLAKLLDWSDDGKVEALAHSCDKLFPLISEKCVLLRRAASAFLLQIAKHPTGKTLIYTRNLTEYLCALVREEEDVEAKLNLAKALQYATIHKGIRKEAFRLNLFNFVIEALAAINVPSSFKLIALKILTNFAELPDGRAALTGMLSVTRDTVTIRLDGSPEMNNAIYLLMRTILKKP